MLDVKNQPNIIMKQIIALLALLVIPAAASTLGLRTVKMPTHIVFNQESEDIKIVDVPFVSAGSFPEWAYSAMNKPFIPLADSSWNKPKDINLTSLYGISVSGSNYDAVVDLTKAKVPEGYSFAIDEVADAVVKCLNLMFPHDPDRKSNLKVEIKR